MFGEIETLRFGYETELLHAIARRFGPIPLLDRVRGRQLLDSRRRDLLGDAVRVTEALLPEVYGAYRSCLERIGGGWVGDLFVCQNPVYNASVFAQGETFDLLVHSSLINEFSSEELRFVFGHELGHVVFQHSAFPVRELV
ncbi:MAG: M48 family metalloprotease, partial [Desulfococcaceae bacterium]